jgi:peptidoglycan/LPS O-acetylase OafA/YrhL
LTLPRNRSGAPVGRTIGMPSKGDTPVDALRPYLKLVNYVVIAVLGSLGAILTDRHGVNAGQVLNLVAVALTAGIVWAKANTPDQPHAKAVVAVLGAGVAVFASAVTDGHVDATELVQIALALLGALQVATVANVPPGTQPEATVAELGYDVARQDGDL